MGPLNPGATVRHVAFTSGTRIEEPPERALPLCFAIVGTLALSANRGTGILIIPDVQDLVTFGSDRPLLTPLTSRDCRVSGATDAALQAQLRLRACRAMADSNVPACVAARFTPTPWASQQKSRVEVVDVPAGDQERLRLFEIALRELPPRLRQRGPNSKTDGSGKTAEFFWADSRIRSLIADNLALGRPWFERFASLMSSPDNARRTVFERKGLHAMIQKIAWPDKAAETVVRAVHEAIRLRFGRIAAENRENPVARKKRWGREYERWRLAFSGAKTADQFRFALTDLWSRAGGNAVLRSSWSVLLPLLADEQWRLARDLTLLGLASYAGRESEEMELTETTDEGGEQ